MYGGQTRPKIKDCLLTGSTVDFVPPVDVFPAFSRGDVRRGATFPAIRAGVLPESIYASASEADWQIAESSAAALVSVYSEPASRESLAVQPEISSTDVALCVTACAEEMENVAGWAVDADRAAEFQISVAGVVGFHADGREPVSSKFERDVPRSGGRGAGRRICLKKQQLNL